MEEILQLVKPELWVLIPVLYLLGKALKKSAVKDKWIPLLLGGAGILLSMLFVLSRGGSFSWMQAAQLLFTSVTQGVLAAGGSVYWDQIVKQMRKEN